jgi:NTP pyrophosphatase (non-canonical NTP hydrolase)
MSDINRITEFLIHFRNERNWAQFHNPKDLAIALSIEAAELNELFLWKSVDQLKDNIRQNREKISDELADVLVYALMLAHELDLDIEKIIMSKMEKNGKKYPVDKSKGNSTKYTEL